jgi:aspartate racemase
VAITFGTGIERRIVAYATLDDQVSAGVDDLKRHLAERLPDYMLPSDLVAVDQMPTTPSGKIDHTALPEPDRARHGRVFVEPRTDLECQLITIWEEVIGASPIGVTDNFFELGGQSLLAVRLISRIEQMLSVHIGLPDLLAAPTIEQLAGRIEGSRASGSQLTVVALQPHGTAVPLFCLCGLFLYRHLAEQLGEGHPVYGVYVPSEVDMIGSTDAARAAAAATSVEDMAEVYLAEIRRIQPEGPYCLAGVSFGGVLAFEVAQRLRCDGQEVMLLALIDAILPQASRFRLTRWAAYHLRQLSGHGPGYAASYAWSVIRRLGRWSLRRSAPQRSDAPTTTNGVREQEIATLRSHIFRSAANRYTPSPYPGKITLFRTTQTVEHHHRIADPTYGWMRYATGGLQMYDVSGSHIGVLEHPHVVVLADHIGKLLDDRRRSDRRPAAPDTDPI